nr:hypothetical protein AXF42_Ash004718 [Ipomoea batatas]
MITCERPPSSKRNCRKSSVAPQSRPSNVEGSEPEATALSNVNLTAPSGFARQSYARPLCGHHTAGSSSKLLQLPTDNHGGAAAGISESGVADARKKRVMSLLHMLPKGTLPPSGPSKGTNEVNN